MDKQEIGPWSSEEEEAKQRLSDSGKTKEKENEQEAGGHRDIGRIDHINLPAADVRATRVFMEEFLGMRSTGQIIFDDRSEEASWVTATNKSCDVAIAEDWTGTKGRLHHVTCAVDSREAILPPQTSAWNTTSSWRPARANMPAGRPSFCTYMNQVATDSRSPTPALG